MPRPRPGWKRIRWPAHGAPVIAFPVKLTPDTASLAPLTVLTVEGAVVPVGTAWSEGPAVLVWLRHFG